MQTSLYNHNTLGSAEKPLIPNIVYKNTIESLNNGETYYYLDVITKFSLERFQKQFLEHKYDEITTAKNGKD